MWTFEKNYRPYVLATIVVFVAFFVRHFIPLSVIFEIPFLLFFSAVVFSGISGGFWCGAYATFLSAFLAHYFFLPPVHQLFKPGWHQYFKISLFIVDCLAMSAVCGKLRASYKLTERLRFELQRLVGDLTSEKEIRERFIAALSHDLRTPLTVAKVSSQLLLKGVETADVPMLATRIVRNIDRADNMIRDLLDAKLISAGQNLYLNKTICRLDEVIRGVIENLSSAHGDRFIFLPEEVSGTFDSGAITRLMENLCTNAIKYGARDKKVTVTLSKEGQEAHITVHNEGNPIPAANLQRIFDQYNRVQNEGNVNQIGWGIGLTLVRGIAEAHGGSVGVESSPSEGTTFSVKLPLL